MQTRELYVDTKRLTCFIVRDAIKKAPLCKGSCRILYATEGLYKNRQKTKNGSLV